MKPGTQAAPELLTPDNAAFISELDPSLPTINDPISEGAGHIQTVKLAVQNSFPNVGAEVSATDGHMNNAFQATQGFVFGFLSMWTGEVDDIPANWVLCDGSQYDNVLTAIDPETGIGSYSTQTTPDMSGMFVRGVEEQVEPSEDEPDDFPGYEPGDTGGEDFPEFTIDGHILTVNELPEHDHDFPFHPPGVQQDNGGNSNLGLVPTEGENTTEVTGGDLPHSHTINQDFEDDEFEQSGDRFDNRPKFYTVAFITYVGADAIPS